jgi:hypothetical protein
MSSINLGVFWRRINAIAVHVCAGMTRFYSSTLYTSSSLKQQTENSTSDVLGQPLQAPRTRGCA